MKRKSDFFVEAQAVAVVYNGDIVIPSLGFSGKIKYGNGLLHLDGANGSGKSTILKLITGELEATKGNIVWGTKGIKAFAVMFQSNGLIRNINVDSNLKLSVNSRSIDYKNELEDCEVLEIEKILYKKAHQLSGGEESSVQIARCILSGRPVWVMDEPTNNLDQKRVMWLSRRCVDEVKKGRVILVVSHDNEWVNSIETELAPLGLFQRWTL